MLRSEWSENMLRYSAPEDFSKYQIWELCSNWYERCSGNIFTRTEIRVKGRSHPETVCDTTPPQDLSNRCESDSGSRGREFDPGLVPYFRGDWSWNNFDSHFPPYRWIMQEGLLSVTSKSMCTKYWLTASSSLLRKSVVRWTDRPTMTMAVDLGRKATKTTKQTKI